MALSREEKTITKEANKNSSKSRVRIDDILKERNNLYPAMITF
jgi:hypothetical protein